MRNSFLSLFVVPFPGDSWNAFARCRLAVRGPAREVPAWRHDGAGRTLPGRPAQGRPRDAPRPAGAGMRKGQVTKRVATTQETFNKIVEQYGDPLVALAEMAFDPLTDPAIRHNSLKEVAKYGYAQRRAIELSGPDGAPIAIEARLGLINEITQAFEKLAAK